MYRETIFLPYNLKNLWLQLFSFLHSILHSYNDCIGLIICPMFWALFSSTCNWIGNMIEVYRGYCEILNRTQCYIFYFNVYLTCFTSFRDVLWYLKVGKLFYHKCSIFQNTLNSNYCSKIYISYYVYNLLFINKGLKISK